MFFIDDDDSEIAEGGKQCASCSDGNFDLILIDPDGRLLLYDYKTDRLSKDELRDPTLARTKMNQLHGQQLSYYAHAASLLFGRPCDGDYVYSTPAGQLYDVELQVLSLPEDPVDIL